MSFVFRVGGVTVTVDSGVMSFTSGLAVDGDGSPHAYHPDSASGLDRLANAGHPGNWWGVVTDDGSAGGTPIVQGAHDPAPGFFVSATSLVDRSRPLHDPRRYVDSETIPYLSLPRALMPLGRSFAHLGDVALVAYNSASSPAILADVGPPGRIGEGSIALARALGIDPSPRLGGVAGGVSYRLFCGSGKGWPRALDGNRAGDAQLASSPPGQP